MIAIIVFGLPCMLALCVFAFRVLALCVLALCMRSLRYLRFARRCLRLFKTGRECGIVRPNVCGKRPKEVLSRKKCLVKTLRYFNMKKPPVSLTTFEARFEQN